MRYFLKVTLRTVAEFNVERNTSLKLWGLECEIQLVEFVSKKYLAIPETLFIKNKMENTIYINEDLFLVFLLQQLWLPEPGPFTLCPNGLGTMAVYMKIYNSK